MNIRRWLKLALLFSLAFAVTAALPFTLSYVFSESGPVVNTFLPPPGLQDQAIVEVLVEKTVRNTGDAAMGPEGFTFILTDSATGEALTAVSDKDGAARFSLLYKGTDAGHRFTYTLREENDGRENITYSERIYTLQVDVDMAEDKPRATVRIDGAKVSAPVARFENICHFDELPHTGDSTCLMLYAAMAMASLLVLALLRRRSRA